LLLFFCLAGCRPVALDPPATTLAEVSTPPSRNITSGCVSNPQTGMDYFPDRITIQHAKQFNVEYHGTYKVVLFRPSVRTGEVIRYVLVQCGLPAPEGYPGATTVRIPAMRIILDDAVVGSALARIGALDHLMGVNNVRDYSTPAIRAREEAGTLVNTGSQGHSTLEAALAADPDVIFPFYSAYPQHNLHPKIREMGLPAVPLATHFESTPLGRAEWLKFMALFVNREREANALFAEIEQQYRAVQQLTKNVRERPEVMWGSPSETEGWSVHGSRNFLAQYIADAGGRYFWEDNDTRSLITQNFEKVFDKAEHAKIWIGFQSMGPTLAALENGEPRLRQFNPLITGQVYAPRRRTGTPPRFIYRDQSLDHPAEVLADLIAILHPELLPNHTFTFFERLK
jgi:iron complex transport system substrate-binding protein